MIKKLSSSRIKEIMKKTRKEEERSLGAQIQSIFEEQKFFVFFLAAAVFFLGVGTALIRGESSQEEKTVVFEREVSEGEADKEEGPIFVDVGGAVEKPGVYELSGEARVKDALIAGGGLAAEADREFIVRQMNLAEKLSDGEKIYIPSKSETRNTKYETYSSDSGIVAGGMTESGDALININTAGAGELQTLKGIGPVRSKEIIDNRPYASKEDLQTKDVLGSKTYEKIKDEITVK